MKRIAQGFVSWKWGRTLGIGVLLLWCGWIGVSLVLANGTDSCPGTLITVLPYNDSTGNTTNMNPDLPHCGISVPPGQRDVVYDLYLSCDYTVTASLCGSQTSLWMNVRTGGACPGDSLVGCDDQACGNLRGQVTFHARGATHYYLVVAGRCTALQCFYGPFVLTVTGTPYVPPNDQCPGPTISSLPYTDIGSNCWASSDYADCYGRIQPDVVYTLNIPTCQLLTVNTCGSNFDTQLDVRTWGTCPGAFSVNCNDDNTCPGDVGNRSLLTFVAAANINYYIIVGGSGNSIGQYVLNVSGVPFDQTNDACPGKTFSTLPYGDYGNTDCAANSFTYPHCGGSFAPDVVYTMTLPTCRQVFAFTCGSGYDTRLDVRTGGDCPGSVLVACNDDASYCAAYHNQYASALTFNAYAGVPYYFIVHGYSDASGPFAFSAIDNGAFTAPQDVCPGVNITSLPFTDVASTACMAHNYTNCLGNSSADAVYIYSPATCQNVTVSLCGSGYDTGLSILRGGFCPGGSVIRCNDDWYCNDAVSLQSTASFQAGGDLTYYILVHGYFTNNGPYILNVTGRPCDSLAHVDSLVIQPADPFVELSWQVQGPAFYFYIYRSTNPSVPIIPANRIDSTSSLNYFDNISAVNPGVVLFYAVTAAPLPSLLDVANGPLPGKAEASPTSEPYFAAGALPGAVEPEIDKTLPTR